MKNSTATNDVTYDEAFELIQNLKKKYLPAVNNLLAGADLKTIVMLNDVKRILTAKDAAQLSQILFCSVNSATASKIGVKPGYKTTISMVKLQNFLKSIDKAYKEQIKNLDTETMRIEIKKLEQLILEQLAEKGELNRDINDILDLTKSFTRDASKNNILTVTKSKKRFEKAADTINTILERRRSSTQTPETVDVKKLQRIYWDKKEEYYN